MRIASYLLLGSAVLACSTSSMEATPSDAGAKTCEDQGGRCILNTQDSGIDVTGKCPSPLVNVEPDPCPSKNQHCCRDGG